MSGWDWFFGAMDVLTYFKVQQAQQNLSDMKTVSEMEAGRRLLIEAMRDFIFDISRDIELAEEQLDAFPQQVYIVSRLIEFRLANSGISTDAFPDISDKDYLFKTQKKINLLVKKARERLTKAQITQSDTAVKYIAEMPLLKKAISAKIAQEALHATNEKWQTQLKGSNKKGLFIGFGLAGLIISLACLCPSFQFAMGISEYGSSGLILSLITMVILFLMFVGLITGSIVLLIRGSKINNSVAELSMKREAWKKQLIDQKEWERVLHAFGNLTSVQFQEIFNERSAFLDPIIEGEIQKYLTPES